MLPSPGSRRWGKRWPSCRRYYASLGLCRPEAFRANATEAYARSQPLEGTRESSTGAAFAELEIPKVFCWGTESLSEHTRRFLEGAPLPNKRFEGAFHWPMIDQPKAFYTFLMEFVEGLGW